MRLKEISQRGGRILTPRRSVGCVESVLGIVESVLGVHPCVISLLCSRAIPVCDKPSDRLCVCVLVQPVFICQELSFALYTFIARSNMGVNTLYGRLSLRILRPCARVTMSVTSRLMFVVQ